jgi:exonuclease III
MNNFRTLVINANSVTGKVAEIEHLINYTDPDAIIMSETKIDKTVSTSEFLNPSLGYTTFRKDRKMGGGGVLIAIKNIYVSTQVEMSDINAEVVWTEILLSKSRKLFVASFYRPPDHNVTPLDSLHDSLKSIAAKIRNNPNSVVIIGGDFNCGDIIWDSNTVKHTSTRKPLHEKLLEIIADHGLSQLQRSPTRESNILDLFLTSHPGLVKTMSTIPGISDHHILVADCQIMPNRSKKPPRNIFKYKDANWDKMREETLDFNTNFVSNIQSFTVQENWSKFKAHLTCIMNRYIPSKTVKNNQRLPWFNNSIKRVIRKKQRQYNKAKRTKKDVEWAKYRSLQNLASKMMKKSRLDYINNMLTESVESKNNKPFWKYIRSQKQDNIGVAPLKEKGVLFSGSNDKARILNSQFQSVFSDEDTSDIPEISGNPVPSIKKLIIAQPGVEKLLLRLNTSKATGPDNIPCRVLKELAPELAPALTALFNQSLSLGTIPVDWSKAFISPIFKKR